MFVPVQLEPRALPIVDGQLQGVQSKRARWGIPGSDGAGPRGAVSKLVGLHR